MNLKEILDAVLLESGVPTETAYAASTDDAVKRMVNLANRSITVLSRYPWQGLRSTYEFTLSDATQYSLPDDYRAFIPDTMYTDSHLWAVDFPADAGEWAYLKASVGGNGIRTKIRILGDKLEIYDPDSGEQIRVEYLTKYPVKDSTGAGKERFTADTDTTKLDDDLVTMDILWRYKKLMGLEWQPDLMEFRAFENTLRGQDQGAQTICPGAYGGDSGPYYDLWRPSSEAV